MPSDLGSTTCYCFDVKLIVNAEFCSLNLMGISMLCLYWTISPDPHKNRNDALPKDDQVEQQVKKKKFEDSSETGPPFKIYKQ